MSYTSAEWRSIEPLVRKAEEQARQYPERRDLFLCHAWEDGAAARPELFELLESNGATVWFSERDVGLGKSLPTFRASYRARAGNLRDRDGPRHRPAWDVANSADGSDPQITPHC